MLGRSHAISGAMASSLALTAVPDYVAAEPFAAAAFVVTTTGAAVLPDADHPNATAAKVLPPLSAPICGVVATVSGGHRKGTHYLLGLIVFAVVVTVACAPSLILGADHPYNTYAVISQAVLTGVCVAMGLGALRVFRASKSPAFGWVAAFLAGALVWYSQLDPLVTIAALVGGCFVHIVGDMLTPQGVQFLWPITTTFRIPILATKDKEARKRREALLASLMIVVTIIAWAYIIGALDPIIDIVWPYITDFFGTLTNNVPKGEWGL